MKKTLFLSLIVILTASLATSYAAETHRQPTNNRIIVKFRQKLAHSAQKQASLGTPPGQIKLSLQLDHINALYRMKKITPLFKKHPYKKQKHLLDRIYKIQFDLKPDQPINEVLNNYRISPDVEYAEPDQITSIHLTPNDTLYPLQWPLNNTGQDYPTAGRYKLPPGIPDSDIDAPEAWDIITNAPNVIVAVVDTGIDYNHRDIDDNLWINLPELNGTEGIDDDDNGYTDDVYGYDFFNNDPDPNDDHGHGTHCSGIIAAETDNSFDIAGVCWTAKIMSVKAFNDEGGGYNSDAIQAIYYAVQNGAHVISNSWGSNAPSQALEEVIDYAHSMGKMVIFSAGNGHTDEPAYPAAYEHTFAVAATDSNDDRARFSNYGDWVDIAAPGLDILSLRAYGTYLGVPYDQYSTIASGTSMACPHVSGACAMLLAANPLLTSEQIYEILMQTGDPIDPGTCISNARLNIYNAILAVISSTGQIRFQDDYYSCDSLIEISLADYDLRQTAAHQITLTTNGGDTETLNLAETDSAIGIFTGNIITDSEHPIPEDGTLQLEHEQIITATYDDADDGSGNPAVATDTAIADCVPPEISNVYIDIINQQLIAHFETDEPATAHVTGGDDCNSQYTVEGNSFNFNTIHDVTLIGALPEKEYFFTISATDIAQNMVVDNNDGGCYPFSTIGLGDVYVPSQYKTIQEAIDNAWDGGGNVWVEDGTYTGQGNYDLDFKGKAITVRSENGPQSCTIDCDATENNPHRAFRFHSREDANSILTGFTITNGYGAGSKDHGGAILCESSNPIIDNCIFFQNYAEWNGGAIDNYLSNPTIKNCIFIQNSAVGNDGGAINNNESSPTITNCIFIQNSAFDWGGAVRNVIKCKPIVKNCLFNANTADDGGAIFNFYRCKPNIYNCTFQGNLAPNGNTLGSFSWGSTDPSQLDIKNCIFQDGNDFIWNSDNSEITITYSNIQGGYFGLGNIDSDPCFVLPGYWNTSGQWVDGDYRLLENSPCINTGDPNHITEPNETDLDANPRILDGCIDMGPYEAIPPIPVEMKITPHLLNCDSRGLWIRALLACSQEFTPEDIDLSRTIIAEPPGIEPESIRFLKNPNAAFDIMLLFGRQDFCQALGENDDQFIEITVKGHLLDGRSFLATDTIKVISDHWRNRNNMQKPTLKLQKK
jgi:subtilisin family serine protease